MNTADDDLRPLPIRPRPHTGETVASYIRRLARANHLRPSYLHGYLSGPLHHLGGRPQPHRLAVLAGRTVSTLERALADLGTKANAKPAAEHRRSVSRTPANQKTKLFTAIRRDAENEGLSIRALAERHQVHRRTVRQALTDPTPPSRKPATSHRPATVLNRVQHHIDTMLASEPHLTARQIWERILDDHDADASYSTITGYIARQRPSLPRQANSGRLH